MYRRGELTLLKILTISHISSLLKVNVTAPEGRLNSGDSDFSKVKLAEDKPLVCPLPALDKCISEIPSAYLFLIREIGFGKPYFSLFCVKIVF